MSIVDVICKFEGISLQEMDQVRLMNRTDRKYWFNIEHLDALLCDIKDDYYILDIDGVRNQPYSTTYYDTQDDSMYHNHHRGKLNRFKIRRREYQQSGSSFLEIKFKSNKGRTIKSRMPSPYSNSSFDSIEEEFISDKCPYRCSDLSSVLLNGFRRLMLVSKTMDERCTIDQELMFRGSDAEVRLDKLVVVEVKSQGRASSPIIDAMNRRRLKPSGFSKYCMGRSITDPDIKQGLFKAKHRLIERHIDSLISQSLKRSD